MKEQRKAGIVPIGKNHQKITGFLLNELKLGSCNFQFLK